MNRMTYAICGKISSIQQYKVRYMYWYFQTFNKILFGICYLVSTIILVILISPPLGSDLSGIALGGEECPSNS